MKKFFSFYGKGLLPTIFLAVIIILIGLLISLTEPVEAFLELFIPKQYLIPRSGLIILLLIIPLILSALTKGRIKKYLGKLMRKVPFLNLIWKEENISSVFEGAVPVAAKLSNVIIYGFLMGRSEVEDNTRFIESKHSLAVFSPSLPIPFTSAMGTEFEPRHVREVEIIGNEGRNQARMAIIQNKCLSMGQPLASKIRYKLLDKTELKELPILSKKEQLALAREIERKLKKLRRSLQSAG